MNSSDICVCCGRYVPEGRQVCFICENEIIDNPKSELQGALLNLRLRVEECVSILEKYLIPLIQTLKAAFLKFWAELKKFLFSKKLAKIIHIAKYGKTARIRKKNKARLIRLFLRKKHKPG